MAEKEYFQDGIIYCEKKEKKIIYTVYDKLGNVATSPNSHQEAMNYLKQRKKKTKKSLFKAGL
jgi:hypothetical protein